MRRQSKIDATLNSLFKKPANVRSNSPVDAAPAQAHESEQRPVKEAKSSEPVQKAKKSAKNAPLRVDTVSTTFKLDLNEVLVSPPFEEDPSTGAVEAPKTAAEPTAADLTERIQDWYGRQIVTCVLNKQLYAIRIDLVESIIKMQAITTLPIPRPNIAGIINLRGKVIPIVNLREVLGFSSARSAEMNKHILLVNADGYRAGLIVDQVNAVLTLPDAAYSPLPSVSSENPFVIGVAKHQEELVLMLDLTKMLKRLA